MCVFKLNVAIPVIPYADVLPNMVYVLLVAAKKCFNEMVVVLYFFHSCDIKFARDSHLQHN